KELRTQMGEKAKQYAEAAFSTSKVTDTLINAFQKSEDTIDIIIPNYNNTKYLLLTVESLFKNTKNSFVIHLVDSGTQDVQPVLDYMAQKKIKHTFKKFKERTSFSKQVNQGLENSSNNIVLIGNNDLIFTKDWDVPLVSKIKENPQ